MRIIPVLDLRDGRAVHARGGDRAHYRELSSILHEGSDPEGIARAYRDALGSRDVYVADLSAIAGAAVDRATIAAIAGLGLRVWVDAGIREARDADALFEAGAGVVIAGLETISGPDVLGELIARHGVDRVAFSLDLRGGRPLGETADRWGTDDPRGLAEGAIGRGARRVIVLDLDRVGAGGGVGTVPLLEGLATDHPGVDWVAGGGVAGDGDLRALRAAGASAALVGSALHDGRIRRSRPSP